MPSPSPATAGSTKVKSAGPGDGATVPEPAVERRSPAPARLSKWTFRRIMLRATLRPALGVFNPRYRAVDLHDPAEVARAANAYRALTPMDGTHPIPKRIWMLWQQGWNQAPDLVRRCAESWREQNPDWQLTLLDQESLPEFVTGYADAVPAHLSRQHRADLARTMLLAEHGGVWADATLFCARPLDDWLPHAARSGFFMFSAPRPYRIVDNWFIAAARDNPVAAGMQEIFQRYVQLFERPHHYFWMIYLIEHLFRTDPQARSIWLETPRLSALGPLALRRHALNLEAPAQIYDLIAEGLVPVHKLKHKWTATDLTGTPLGRLTGLSSIRE